MWHNVQIANDKVWNGVPIMMLYTSGFVLHVCSVGTTPAWYRTAAIKRAPELMAGVSTKYKYLYIQLIRICKMVTAPSGDIP